MSFSKKSRAVGIGHHDRCHYRQNEREGSLYDRECQYPALAFLECGHKRFGRMCEQSMVMRCLLSVLWSV